MKPAAFSSVAVRFAWKEYRTLRAMWLAVGLLGIITQFAAVAFSSPGANVPAAMFGIAWGAAVLYAVGATAVLFSVEHEDQTHAFLSGLPARWQPLLAGKLAAAAASVVLLASVLSLTGWAFAGWASLTSRRWPSATEVEQILLLLGVGIVEALAWGTLFSLLVKRPLVAALLTIVVGTLVMQLAASAMSSQPVALSDSSTYGRAVPLRLAIVATVSAAVVLVTQRWLAVGTSEGAVGKRVGLNRLRIIRQWLAHAIGRKSDPAKPVLRGRMLTHLLWQTWRENWKRLVMPFAVAGGVWLAVALVFSLVSDTAYEVPWMALPVLFLPAVFGALVFGADQRRRQYRFLAEHAARPGYIWLARHLVWFGTLVGAAIGIALLSSVLMALALNHWMQQYIELRQWEWNMPMLVGDGMRSATVQTLRGVGLLGVLAAYAVGQACSMVFRSEIISAFVAMMLSVLVAAWCAVLFLWLLSGMCFVLPIAVGLLLATWLRAPDWITERNSWRGWWKPAAAVAMPIALVAAALPPTRLAQVPNRSADIEPLIADYRAGNTAAARETAAMYEQAVAVEQSWRESDLLERWSGPEFAATDELGLSGSDEIDEAKIPVEQLDDYHRALEARQERYAQAWVDAAKLAVAASRRPTCRFDLDWSATTVPTPYQADFRSRETDWRRAHSTFDAVMYLAYRLVSSRPDRQPTVDELVAAVRMCGHLREGQPTAVAVRSLEDEEGILRMIAARAESELASAEQVRELLDRLETEFRRPNYDPIQSLVADDLLVRNVLIGKTLPLAFAESPIRWSSYLAYLANGLPWERERGLRALDAITLQNIADLQQFYEVLYGQADVPWNTGRLRQWLRPNYLPAISPIWLVEQYQASTSYLTRLEYEQRVPINYFYRELAANTARRRALLIQLALLLYHRNHDQYPPTLAELVPNYLDALPLDPYLGGSFHYSPQGLDLPLRRSVYADRNALPPRTPFIWSIGPNDAELSLRESRAWEPERDDDDEPVEARSEYYVLTGGERFWDNVPGLIFPLPK